MKELKDCPFCGDSATYAYGVGKYGAYGYVECELCGARSKTRCLPNKPCDYNDDKEFWEQNEFQQVAKYWNRRADEK